MNQLERPLPSMAPDWARLHPSIWSVGHGVLAAVNIAGLVRYAFGGSTGQAWLAGALTGMFQFSLQRSFVNRGPWQPRWGARIFNPRRIPPWVNGLILIWLIPVTARPLSRGIIDGEPWKVLWGIEFLLTTIALVIWTGRYWSKVQAEDRAWAAERASADPPVDLSSLKEAPPPLPGTYGGIALQDARSPSLEMASPLRRLSARAIDWTILFVAAGSMADALVPDADTDTWGNVFFGLFGAMFFVSEVLLIAIWGQTPGKFVTRIKVSISDEGDSPGPGRSLLRWLTMAALIVGFPFGLYSYLSLIWNKRRQTWYDKASGTIVLRLVKKREWSPPPTVPVA